jgi:hypothetical protein
MNAPNGNGICCPGCGGRRIRATSRYSPVPGLRFKYTKCRDCETTFKIQEQVIPVIAERKFAACRRTPPKPA